VSAKDGEKAVQEAAKQFSEPEGCTGDTRDLTEAQQNS
jgi:hypothetical protein